MQLSLLPSRHEAPGFDPQHCKTKERKGEKEEKRAKKKKELTAFSHINNILVGISSVLLFKKPQKNCLLSFLEKVKTKLPILLKL